jgi:hypothetical protein
MSVNSWAQIPGPSSHTGTKIKINDKNREKSVNRWAQIPGPFLHTGTKIKISY